MLLQNDQSVLFSDKPFLPFGTTPSLGSAFYIGNGETFSKKLNELKLNINWHEIPNWLSDDQLADMGSDLHKVYSMIKGFGWNSDGLICSIYWEDGH